MASGTIASIPQTETVVLPEPTAGPDYLASFRLVSGFLSGSRLTLLSTLVLATIAVAAELVPVWAGLPGRRDQPSPSVSTRSRSPRSASASVSTIPR